MQENTQSQSRIHAVHRLWSTWAVSFGALTAVILMSGYLVPKIVMPAVVLILAGLLSAYASASVRRASMMCANLSQLMVKSLVVTAFVQIICLIICHTPSLNSLFGTGGNQEIPYITSLIIYPSTAVIMAWSMLFGSRRNRCRACRQLRGTTTECDALGNVFSRVAHRQVSTMMWICLVVSAIEWAYYLLFYINSNINSPDKYFFFFVPVAVYILSLVYIGREYHVFISEIHQAFMVHGRGGMGRGSEVRFLVLRGDRMLIGKVQDREMPAIEYADTPAQTEIAYTSAVSSQQAEKLFNELSGCNGGYELRQLYSTTLIAGVNNVYHYNVIMNDGCELPADWKLGDDWVTLDQLDRLLKMGAMAPALAAELNRILTITMAWKTYDRQGRRLYPIKNYRPTFRLRDARDWDVDYNDPVWLSVASDNQDRPLYRLRRMLRKITGLWMW